MDKVFLEATHDGYSVDQVGATMTVRELINYLEDHFYDSQPIYISNDKGYTYGPVTESSFREGEV